MLKTLKPPCHNLFCSYYLGLPGSERELLSKGAPVFQPCFEQHSQKSIKQPINPTLTFQTLEKQSRFEALKARFASQTVLGCRLAPKTFELSLILLGGCACLDQPRSQRCNCCRNHGVCLSFFLSPPAEPDAFDPREHYCAEVSRICPGFHEDHVWEQRQLPDVGY